ncbi:hypothetical protein PLEOSDRAFT_1088364 [Pleurotus ostreatus PC15]|uniref:NAD(P)-binding domain-containing protein n=2 Tax=Pleurotus TaxID=5320 RepID=A0A067NTT0_PLEO1|nr:hypothetical protein CCMSSC00406_0000136 [Pleurotus cornucopiae]KDQ30405.1 hypothetical protein PLEOSDRAFT_1088364 [Pleurotus ostreatus PC15]
MRILVFGATGASGIIIVRELLAKLQSPTVVIYARSPEKLPEDIATNPQVIVIKGELDDEDGLDKALEGSDVVVSVLGPIVTKGPFHPSGTPLAKAYERIIGLMKKKSIKRLLALGTASNADPADKFSLKFSTLVAGVATFARNAYKDVVAWGELIRKEDDLEWTLMRVAILTSGESKEYAAGYIGAPNIGTFLSRAAYAAFVVDEIERREWVRKAPMIASV